MPDLWQRNTPDNFWMIEPTRPLAAWQAACEKALPALELPGSPAYAHIPALTLGEGRFGPDHWRLSLPRRLYYLVKPAIPRVLTRLLRRVVTASPSDQAAWQHWPVDERYARFQLEVLRELMLQEGAARLAYRAFWPDAATFSLVLTHDIETARGQSFVRELANCEENLGFRSCFNFVLARYDLDLRLMDELRERGFEVGCHGLKHDGRLFSSRQEFERRAARINAGLKRHGMRGFRSPLTHRQPEWMQSLEVDYDSSFFDTDPFEPVPGGSMSIWPFFLGHFIELPYTLVQDYTLHAVLNEQTPRLWLEKVDFIQAQRGMALLNTHPDYMIQGDLLGIYQEFLTAMQTRADCWKALPAGVSDWWRARSLPAAAVPLAEARLEGDRLIL